MCPPNDRPPRGHADPTAQPETSRAVQTLRAAACRRSALTRQFGPQALHRALHEAGFAQGRIAAAQLLPTCQSEPALAVAKALRLRQKEGHFRWQESTPTDTLDEIVLERCFEALAVKSEETSPEPVCFETAGFLAGLVTEAFGLDYYAVEHACAAQGRPACRFRLVRARALPPHLRWLAEHSEPNVPEAMAAPSSPAHAAANPDPQDLDAFVASSPPMRRIVQQILQWRELPRLTAFCGAPSTGRRTLAHLIARRFLGPDAPFASLDARGGPPEVMHTRLFGEFRGGAKSCLIQQASGGVLFVWNPECLPAPSQAALARLVQDPPRQDGNPAAFIIAARQPLHQLAETGHIHGGLHQAAGPNVFLLPSLAQRTGDIPPLVHHYLRHFAAKYDKPGASFDRAALDLLERSPWPGNAAELMNTIEYAVLYGQAPRLGVSALPTGLSAQAVNHPQGQITAETLRAALQQTEGRRKEAAALLGIDRTTLWRAIKRFGIDAP